MARGDADIPPVSSQAIPQVALQVNGYSEQWLGRGFPWVYKDEVLKAPRGLKAGDAVAIRGPSGAGLGVGLWDPGHVAVRRWREDAGRIDEALVRERLSAALARRPLPPQTTAFRWVHGENDDMPGVRIDVWGGHVGVVLDAPSMAAVLPWLLDGVVALFPEAQAGGPWRATWLAWRPAAGEEAGVRGLPAGRVRAIEGEQDEDVEVSERGLRVRVRPGEGFDAGLYCDMREVRAWLAPHWSGRRVLNTFGFTGAFTVAAALGGAREVVTVDLAPASLARAEQNLRLNGVDPAGHPMIAADVFQALDRLRRKDERFDVVIADPPSFARGPDGPWSAAQDFPRLVASALRVLRPGGWLVAATNNGKVSPKAFQEQIQDGARRAGRRVRVVHQGSPPPDFPCALAFPESRYLKCWVIEA